MENNINENRHSENKLTPIVENANNVKIGELTDHKTASHDLSWKTELFKGDNGYQANVYELLWDLSGTSPKVADGEFKPKETLVSQPKLTELQAMDIAVHSDFKFNVPVDKVSNAAAFEAAYQDHYYTTVAKQAIPEGARTELPFDQFKQLGLERLEVYEIVGYDGIEKLLSGKRTDPIAVDVGKAGIINIRLELDKNKNLVVFPEGEKISIKAENSEVQEQTRSRKI